ncbi:hypothetical protein TIFTF001_032522 [Ficus carica]|uniref:Uncharacterized protein n=1 Tax=Ficus carica TaxID=3494 RepID=A0AA88DXM5_FICCA|nr:hypothetical protein TIFTF001_032522 [Ficus carica]
MLTNLSSGKMSRKTYKQNVLEKATRASVVPPDDDRVESLGNFLKLRAGHYYLRLADRKCEDIYLAGVEADLADSALNCDEDGQGQF